jgi:hypothetical protein
MASALPLEPREQDGRLLEQLGVPMNVPFPEQEKGASTPVQLVQVPV